MAALLERDDALAALRSAVDARVPCVLVGGEAGSGKTTLVRHFLSSLEAGSWVLGGCDSLSTARPLGPFLDWGSDPDVVLGSVRVAVIEDVHWADDATLALLARLSRRPAPDQATVLLTYREDQVEPPLAVLLGDLSTRAPVRLSVPALSRAAVAQLAADSELDPRALHEATGGNPFFVTECLASRSLTASANVRDAVLARVSTLPPGAREAVQCIAAVPGSCPLWLAEALGASAAAIDDAVTRGVLVQGAGSVALRHELARLTVHASLPPARARELHQRAAQALAEPPHGLPDHAAIVHHAVRGEAGELVARHVRPAADAAIAAGARTQAVAHLALAVRHASGSDLGELYADYAEQLSLLGRQDEAIAAYQQAIGLARAAGAEQTVGRLLARQSAVFTAAGRLLEAHATAQEAVETLSREAPSKALALGYAQIAALHMLARELDQAEPWGQRALDLARRLGDPDAEAYAAIQSGVGRWMNGDEEGLQRLRYGIALARQHDLHALVGLGLSQIGSGGGEIRRYDVAVPALEEAVRFCDEHELGSRGGYAQAWLGRCLVELGEWDRAARHLEAAAGPRADRITRITAITALGRLRSRRGDPGVEALLDEAAAIALPTGQLQRIWPVAAARAEAAWLKGRLDRELSLLRRAHAMAQEVDYCWAEDELAFWLQRAGEPAATSGRTPQTAEQWRALGCDYQAALVDSDDRRALAVFERLGAGPAAALLVERRRAAGLSVPRGPNATTLRTPGGLTTRELDVLRLVAAGHTNAQIAAALHLSVKTVGHHVSHILGKLEAGTRTEAVSRAATLGVALT